MVRQPMQLPGEDIDKIGQNGLEVRPFSLIPRWRRVYYYAHFDSYAPGISEGDYVTPESVLGYVDDRQCAGHPATPSLWCLHFDRRHQSFAIANR